MKKKSTLLFAFGLMIAALCNAQINKGASALGGNLYFSNVHTVSANTYKLTTTELGISPSFMTVYTTNRAIGFSLTYSHSNSSYLSQHSKGYGAGVFLRQYKPLGKGFYIFAQEALNYSYLESKFASDSSLIINVTKTNSIGLTVNPGFAYDLSRKVQLEILFFNNLLSAGYMHQTLSTNAFVSKTDLFSVVSNLDASQIGTLNLGMKVFFGR